jgi:hypothetical protein
MLKIGILLYMYLTTTVATQIGIEQVGTASSLIITIVALHYIVTHNINKLISRFKEEFFIVFIALIIIIIKLITDDFGAIKQVFFFLIIPATVSILMATQTCRVKIESSSVIIFFFITECLLSIYEKVYLVNIFPAIEEEAQSYAIIQLAEFRSTAFLGHPLLNALCVSTIMGFILTSQIKLIKKFFLTVIGYISLLCFNARGAIIIWSLIGVIYMFSAFKKEKNMILSLVLFPLVIYIIYYLVVTYYFGGRLFQADELFDGSAMARLDVFNAFKYINKLDFWIGNQSNYLYVMEQLGAGGVENSYIVLAINYGIFLATLLSISFFFFIKRILQSYALNDKAMIIASFALVGSMNNSLATPTSWMFFIFTAHSFFPIKSQQPVKSKLSPG